MINFIINFLLFSTVICSANYNQSSKFPTLIDSDEGIECVDNNKTCVAKKNVKVTKGKLELYCDKLTAKLRETSTGQNEIYFLEAEGNVRFFGIEGDKSTSTNATYDMDKRKLVLFKKIDKEDNPIVYRKSINLIKAPRFEVYLTENNELKKVRAIGKSTIDIDSKKMLKKDSKKQQIRALFYPNSFEKAKPKHGKLKSKR